MEVLLTEMNVAYIQSLSVRSMNTVGKIRRKADQSFDCTHGCSQRSKNRDQPEMGRKKL